mgnify:CR=1 FL=1
MVQGTRGARNLTEGSCTGNILRFALPLLAGDSILKVLPPVESRPYIGLTLDALRVVRFERFTERFAPFIDARRLADAYDEILNVPPKAE